MARIQSRYHKIDGWRGYRIPGPAVAGASDTGNFDDSPCPSHEVKAELRRFVKECLTPAGIKARTRYGNSSNVFCTKRWIVVDAADWPRAFELANAWIEENKYNTRYIHDAK
jgi:hypothetical protein